MLIGHNDISTFKHSIVLIHEIVMKQLFLLVVSTYYKRRG